MSPTARYTRGMYRTRPPEETLAWITPIAPRCGVTRWADVTRLDLDFGVPTYCAVRPSATILQVSNGKGLSPTAAKVSAIMECIELEHAETPRPERLRRASFAELQREGARVLDPRTHRPKPNVHISESSRLEWASGEQLGDGAPVWAPASLIYADREPELTLTDGNGLASGNHAAEARLHALYEIIERDAISRVGHNGRFRFKGYCRIVDGETLDDPVLSGVLRRIEATGSKVVLLWVPSVVRVHTFWSILLNDAAVSVPTRINYGYGTHSDPLIAAARAVTESVQSRLTAVHGAREDVLTDMGDGQAAAVAPSRAFDFLAALQPDIAWADIEDADVPRSADLEGALAQIVSELEGAGHAVFAFDLTKPEIGVPVVKVMAPTLRYDRGIFQG